MNLSPRIHFADAMLLPDGRHLEASLIACDKDVSLILNGNGDVLEPHDGVLSIGSGPWQNAIFLLPYRFNVNDPVACSRACQGDMLFFPCFLVNFASTCRREFRFVRRPRADRRTRSECS